MIEEQALLQRFGRQNPFTVPEGYFEGFTSRMMNLLDEEQARQAVSTDEKPRAKVRSLTWRRYAVAASIAAVIIGGAVWLVQPSPNVAAQHFTSTPAVAASSATVDHNIDQMADYAMLDNQDIYTYLADY